ncbi:tetrahydromethanopterin S-methyltransferase subunit E [Methanosarcina sp. UBA5]|uniref:tetrahydromethanopterin S-methyltransferase subunit E n=1 Tax=Methanosarcina sp. UBA5 TaxID=1915593 RepID=UPI0025EBF572|nr:tetrahydromethanopterin S-methyltransferase subunit E [Methanosarcina sp. UBA5]
MEPLISMGVLALIGAAATIAGASEDLESDVGSQSNANSQVQLAPQMGYVHRIYNKAIAGEPVSNGLMCTVGSTGALVLIQHFGFSPLFALVIGALIAAMVHGSYSVTAIMGREASQARFKQPIYLDLIRSHTPVIMAFAFLTTFSVEVVSYLLVTSLAHPFPFVLLSFLWGVVVGSVGSATGDVHLGAERQFQQQPFGEGLNASQSGNIVRKAESGLRNGIDNLWFCSKFGGPMTGVSFGMVVFLGTWIILVFDPAKSVAYGWLSNLLGLLIVTVLCIWNWHIEKETREKYGPFKEDKGEEVSA